MFQCRKKQKDFMLKDKVKKTRQEEQLLEKSKPESAGKNKESKEAVKHWLAVKNKELNNNKTLYTYKEGSGQCAHEKAWRPARSVQYAYPKEKLLSCKHSRPPSKSAIALHSPNTTRSTDSYSDASFESEDPKHTENPYKDISNNGSPQRDSIHSESVGSFSDDSSGNEESTDGYRHTLHAPLEQTGKLKSVQVCCQVVQYWCTCHDSN